MLLGRFLSIIREEEPEPLSADALKAGMPVVAVAGMAQLHRLGLPSALHFGVATGEGSVICRRCVKEDMDSPRFEVEEIPIRDFLMPDAELYPCVGAPAGDINALRRARWFMDTDRDNKERRNKLHSYPGDDFVAECLQGDIDWMKLLEDDPYAGKHLCTPFKVRAKEAIHVLEGWGIFKNLLSICINHIPLGTLLDTFHHGISIECGQVIHFSTCRLPEEMRPQIKTDSREDFFRSCDKDDQEGGAVKYKKELPEQRLMARHRAVWIFCHAQGWGEYNLRYNNCEHFSRFCRVGKMESRQVYAKPLESFACLLDAVSDPKIRILASFARKIAHDSGRPNYDKIDDRTTLQQKSIYGECI